MRCSIPTSLLSLHGRVRHTAEEERGRFGRTLLVDDHAPDLFGSRGVEDSELVPLDDADWGADLLRELADGGVGW